MVVFLNDEEVQPINLEEQKVKILSSATVSVISTRIIITHGGTARAEASASYEVTHRDPWTAQVFIAHANKMLKKVRGLSLKHTLTLIKASRRYCTF